MKRAQGLCGHIHKNKSLYFITPSLEVLTLYTETRERSVVPCQSTRNVSSPSPGKRKNSWPRSCPPESSRTDFEIQRRNRYENVKKKETWGFVSKRTTLHVRHAFLYIFLPFLHDLDVKMAIFAFYGERKLISLSELRCGPEEFNFRRVRLHLTK